MYISNDLMLRLPVDCRQKLDDLLSDRIAAHGAVLTAGARFRAEIDHADRMEAIANEGEASDRLRSGANRLLEKQLTDRQLAAEAARAEVPRYQAAYDKACERLRSFAYLDAAGVWLQQQVAFGSKLSRARAIPTPPTGDLVGTVRELRQKIADLDRQLDNLEMVSRPGPDAHAAMLAALSEIAAAGAPRIDTRRDGDPADLRRLIRSGTQGGVEAALSFLVWVLEPTIVDRLQEAFPPVEGGLSQVETGRAFRDLRAKKLAAEREEEAAIVAMEAKGQTFARRPGLDPRALLGLA